MEVNLRSVELSDAYAIFSLINSNRIKLRQWLTFVDATQNVNYTKSYIEGTRIYNPIGDIVFVIEYCNTIVGLIGFEAINLYRRKAELGYWISPEYQGKGIMTQAVSIALRYGFDSFSFNRIEIKCAVGNVKSNRIAEKFGFTFEGTERDGELLSNGDFVDVRVYSLLKKEYAT